MKDLLQHVRILDPVSQQDQVADVLIEAGQIVEIAPEIRDRPNDINIRECQGMILAPGLVDLYSHSGEPGFEERETLLSLAHAAAVGGFTRVAILPDTVPSLDTPASFTWFAEKTTSLSVTPLPQLLPWAALTQDVKGQHMTELAELAQTGAVGFGDGKPISNLSLVRRILEYLRPIAKPILLWACAPDLAGGGVMREGQDSVMLGLPGIPSIVETTALAALLECVEVTGTPVHFMRISTARSVELLRAAKARGVPITASTTWLHLLLNTEHVASYNPSLRLDPPLGTPTDQQALIQAVQEGVIDAIAIDHTPYTYEEKTVAFAEAPPGAIGLELALPLLWQTFVETQQWSALDLWAALSTRPAQCLQQPPPSLRSDQGGEMVLFDPHTPWMVESRSLKSLSTNTFWLGKNIQGRVVQLWK